MESCDDALAFEDFNAKSRDKKIDAVKKVIQLKDPADAFFVGRTEDIENNFSFWQKKCPKISPYYDASCNDSVLVLETMSKLGIQLYTFRNRTELDQLLKVGISGERLFFKSSAKVASQMRFASNNDVNLISFENNDDLKKISSHAPNCKGVFQMRSINGEEEGIQRENFDSMLKVAQECGVNIVGVTIDFDQVDLNNVDFDDLKHFFESAHNAGHKISYFDLGILFPILGNLESFEKKCESVLSFVELLGKEFEEMMVMANLSTFVVKSAFSLAVRIVESGESEKPSYLINEGIHGAFWRLLETDEILKPKLITGKEAVDCEINFASDIFGPTKNCLDQICSDVMLPICKTGDWILFENVGNYYMGALNTLNITVEEDQMVPGEEKGF